MGAPLFFSLYVQTVEGEDCTRSTLLSAEIDTEWNTLRHYLTKQPKEDLASQLHELLSNDMLQAKFSNLNTLANIPTIPVATASVERSFSQMKMIKTRLRNRMGKKFLSHLMKISIESQKLSDSDSENIVDVWNRKNRIIIV